MLKKFKDELRGKRLILRRSLSTIKNAQNIFEAVKENRRHLRPWFPWEKETKVVEDSLKYLFNHEEFVKKGEKAGYGIYLDDKFIGHLGLFDVSDKNKSGEIGYWLSKNYTRCGYMTEAVKLLENEAFRVGLNRIQIKCDKRNVASSGVALKCGYILEAERRQDTYSDYFKDFRNTLIFSKLKTDFLKEEINKKTIKIKSKVSSKNKKSK
jgi:RimJ/RimL family protein N-acetyltransferase